MSIILAMTILCFINVNYMFLSRLDKVTIKIQMNYSNQLGVTWKLTGSLSLLSLFSLVIKIILVTSVYTAPVLFQTQHLYSATQMNLSTRAQIAFLLGFSCSVTLNTVSVFNLDYLAIIKATSCNALKVPLSTELRERFPDRQLWEEEDTCSDGHHAL